jgi:hypothetical protein
VTPLRTALREITQNGRPDSHPRLIAELTSLHKHDIEVVASPTPIDRYTCAVHAFDLVDDQEYEAIVLASPDHVYASPSFVQRLIDRGRLERIAEGMVGGLIIYRADGTIQHIGRLISPERVESKWGVGHLYRHGLLAVPLQYGSEIEFAAAIRSDAVLDELVEFARENGVEFE